MFLKFCILNILKLSQRLNELNILLITNYNEGLINKLRELRFGVTTYEGEGINKEKRYKLEIVSHRSRENEVISLIQSLEKNAFIVSYEPTQFRGGYITKQLKKL